MIRLACFAAAAMAALAPAVQIGRTLLAQSDSRATPLVIEHVTLIDGTGAAPRSDQTIVMENGRITALGPSTQVTSPTGATVIDGRGQYVIPGLFDMHVHLSKARASTLAEFVVNGVTTVRDAGGDWAELQQWRREIRSGERVGPRVAAAGPYLESTRNVTRMRASHASGDMVEPVGRTRVPVDSVARARAAVDSVAALGVDFIKIRTVASLAVYREIAAAAKDHGLALAGHTEGIPLEVVIEAGQHTVEHLLYPVMDDVSAAERQRLFRAMSARGVRMVPTLVNWEYSAFASDSVMAEAIDSATAASGPAISAYLLADWREQLAERGSAPAGIDWNALYRSTLRNLREMHDAGVTILPGTDVAVVNIFPGRSLHDELALLVDSVGLTPMEAIVAATHDAAETLGIADSVGTVEVGQRADLLLLAGNPLRDIRNTRTIAAVVIDGRLFSRAGLDSLATQARMAPDRRANDWY